MHCLVLFFTFPCSLQHFIKHNCHEENIYLKKLYQSANQVVHDQLQNSERPPKSLPFSVTRLPLPFQDLSTLDSFTNVTD